ncbi:DUF4012 domain-containing protein [Micromonospora sp. NPDC049559]|uniref:DUF4012 domain-containing protein n=1 Tax=Micromonospora sp. NPDC049559 TaxID=3155923 RepID=UPI003432DBC6
MTATSGKRRRRSRGRRRLRRVLLAALVCACLVSLSGGWLVLRGWQTREHLVGAMRLARSLSEQVRSGDLVQARRTLAALQQQTAGARSSSGDPAWRGAGHLPYAGRNFATVQAISIAVDDLARLAFPALLSLDPAALVPKAGRLDLAALRSTAPTLAAAEPEVRKVDRRVDALPTAGLHPQVRDALRQLRDELDNLTTVTTAARIAAALLPPILGANGARTYLLVSQNLAELRATGGIWGAYAAIRTEGGQARIVAQGGTASEDLPMFPQPVLQLSPEMRALYGDLPGIYAPDVNLTPHFPTAAKLYREMYRRRSGTSVDGVLATDPVVLSYLLQAIGPVQVTGQTGVVSQPTLAATTAVRTLLSDTYRTLDLKAQDRYFAASARAVFEAILQRPIDPRALMTVLDRAVEERRLLFWSAHEQEQEMIAGTRLAGVLPEREQVPTVGVFLNDGSGAKLGYYLTHEAELTVGDCRRDGRRELRLRVTLSSSAPRSGLSSSVLGLGLSGEPYTARTLVYLFSPARGSVVSARLDGTAVAVGSGTERGRHVGIVNVETPPGRTRVLEATLLTPVDAPGTADLWLTPGVSPWTTHISSAPDCKK